MKSYLYGLAALATLTATPAVAGDTHFSFGVYTPAPYYYAPAPVVYRPVAYYAPVRPVFYAPRRYAYRDWHGRGHGHGHRHHDRDYAYNDRNDNRGYGWGR